MRLFDDRLLRLWRKISDLRRDAMVRPPRAPLSSRDWLAPHLAAPFATDLAALAAAQTVRPHAFAHRSCR